MQKEIKTNLLSKQVLGILKKWKKNVGHDK